MEIPIQVAVRIYPCATPPKPLQADADEQLHRDENANSYNNNDNGNGNDNDTDGNNKECGEENANTVAHKSHVDGGKERSAADVGAFVQAIPIAATAPGFLSNAPMALPGHLDNSIASGLVQVGRGPHSFPVTHALRADCTQTQIYHQTVFPLICLFLEGFDASIVTYGQAGMGKTYTLYGPGFDCVYGEADQGVVQRCVREIFTHMSNRPERKYAVNIGWVEIGGEVIRDLLGVGNVHCASISDVFHWLQIGLGTRAANTPSSAASAHTLFTLTLEQQWVSKEGLIQHRLSTASFSDLCGTERMFAVDPSEPPSSVGLPRDAGLQALEMIVDTLTNPTLMYGVNGNIPYNRTTLTTLLKDSFGGRAQTLVILCVSPLERDVDETVCNLQFAFKVQCVRNYVIVNTFSDDNTPISPEVVADLSNIGCLPPPVADNFGLQFAANQWFKLVSNAEGLLSRLISSNAVSDIDKEQIEEWLFLKQECEECLSSSEALRTQKQLGPIQEADEPEETVSEPETSCQQNSDNESDAESQRPDLDERLGILMAEFRHKTDTLASDKYKKFIQRQPKAVMESQDSLRQQQQQPPTAAATAQAPKQEASLVECQAPPANGNNNSDERKTSIGGRRRSLQPGATLSSAEIAMLNRVASREHTAATARDVDADFLDSNGAVELHSAAQLRAASNSPLENLQRKMRKLEAEIEARQRQMKEIEETMQLKQNIITELVKNSETRTHAKQRFNKKKAKLETEYEKTKKQLGKALLQGRDKVEVERLRALLEHIEQRLQDLSSIKHIAGESGQKVKKLQQSMHESKKALDDLHKKVKKERKMRDQLQAEICVLRERGGGGGGGDARGHKALMKLKRDECDIELDLYEHRALAEQANEEEEENADAAADADDDDGKMDERGKNLRARISHLEHVLREKSATLAHEAHGEQHEGLRHEIRNLRRTRDHLLEQRCTLDRKKREKMLSQREERKLLECDEAIEAIDAAIEFKNELICGHKSIDTSERLQREKGEQMLMARLNKLTPEEMRTLLYKYFVKVIDLRDSSRKLEVQVIQLERERDAWEWKERVLSNAVRQARLEGERNVVLLQRQHEMKLSLMMRHLAEETSASSASYSDAMPVAQQHQHQQSQHAHAHTHHHHHSHSQRYMRPNTLALAPAQPTHLTSPQSGTTPPSQFSDSDFDLDFYKSTAAAVANTQKMLKPPKHGEMEMCPLTDALAKYKPLDKLKEKERETKNKLFAKFQVLTRYAGQTLNSHAAAAAGGEHDHNGNAGVGLLPSGKKRDKTADEKALVAIPQENLKRLISTSPAAAKVTRQKNKIIIQNATRKN